MNSEKVKSWWEKQKDGRWKTLTETLSQDSEVHFRFDNLITAAYWKFREQKGIPKGTYNPEIDFEGFKSFEDFPQEKKMGYCKLETKIFEHSEVLNGKKVENSETYEYKAKLFIYLSQKYLLNKLGMDEFISDYQELEENDEKGSRWKSSWNSLPIGFDKLIETIAHELAHAYQNTINLKEEGEKSQCDSSGDRDANGNLLYPELVSEHTQLTSEIKQMIESSADYQEFRKWWRGEELKKNSSNQPNSWQKIKDKTKETTKKIGDTSSATVKKTGEGLEKAGQKLKESANEGKWPRWVLPVGIVFGGFFCLWIIVWIFKPKR